MNINIIKMINQKICKFKGHVLTLKGLSDIYDVTIVGDQKCSRCGKSIKIQIVSKMEIYNQVIEGARKPLVFLEAIKNGV